VSDTYSLIKPYSVKTDGSGNGIIEVMHGLNGLAWEIQQIGLSLQQAAPSPQVGVLINSIPWVSSVVMGTSVFASIPGFAPVAMTTQLSERPWAILEAGDRMLIGVVGATPGDMFTAGLFLNEVRSPALGAAETSILTRGASVAGHLSRPGQRRWHRLWKDRPLS
jgi:hypothetical protein